MSVQFRKQWKTGENITPEKATQFLSEPVQYMYQKNLSIVQVGSTENIIRGTGGGSPPTFYSFDRPMILRLNTIENETVCMSCSGVVQQTRLAGSATAIAHKYDILIDNEYYLSSMESTPLSDGSFLQRISTSNNLTRLRSRLFMLGLSEGSHTFELVASSGNVNFDLRLQPFFQFQVEGYGVNIGNLIAGNAT